MTHRAAFIIATAIIALSISTCAPKLPPLPPTPTESCEGIDVLWTHVYHGRYATPQQRLVIQQPCQTVTGVIFFDGYEADGDRHVRVKLDLEFENLLLPPNHNVQHDGLVVEPMCTRPPTQADTLREGVCDGGFNQNEVYTPDMLGKHVSVTGALVTDVEPAHGWREIHPVVSIRVIGG